MKTSAFLLLLPLFCFQSFAAVQHAHIAQRTKAGKFHYQIDPRYAQHNFAGAFKGVNLARDGEETEDGVFGHPIRLIVQADEGNFLLYVNNVEDVFSIYRLRKSKGGYFLLPGRQAVVRCVCLAYPENSRMRGSMSSAARPCAVFTNSLMTNADNSSGTTTR